MDSTLDYVHWEKSSLTVFADAWIGDQATQESISIPQQFDFDQNVEKLLLTLKESKKPEKLEWNPNPMDV